MARRSGLLAWIIAFKALKATVLAALGVGLLTTRHSDPLDLFLRFALAIHLPLTSRLVERAIAWLSNLAIDRRTILAATAFAYAVLMASEGIALYQRKPWARWFTIVATSSLIPFEVYEILLRPHLTRVIVLAVNVGVVIYLWRRADLLQD